MGVQQRRNMINNHVLIYNYIGFIPFIIVSLYHLFNIKVFRYYILTLDQENFIDLLLYGLTILFIFSIIWRVILRIFKNVWFLIWLVYLTFFIVSEILILFIILIHFLEAIK